MPLNGWSVESQEDEEEGLLGAKDRKADATSLPGSKILVVVDSQVRF